MNWAAPFHCRGGRGKGAVKKAKIPWTTHYVRSGPLALFNTRKWIRQKYANAISDNAGSSDFAGICLPNFIARHLVAIRLSYIFTVYRLHIDNQFECPRSTRMREIIAERLWFPLAPLRGVLKARQRICSLSVPFSPAYRPKQLQVACVPDRLG